MPFQVQLVHFLTFCFEIPSPNFTSLLSKCSSFHVIVGDNLPLPTKKKKKTKKKPHTMVEEPAAECKRLLYCAQLCFRGLLHGTKHRTLNLR